MNDLIYSLNDSETLFSNTSKIVNSETFVLDDLLEWDRYLCYIVDLLDTWKNVERHIDFTPPNCLWFKSMCIFNILCLKNEIFNRFKTSKFCKNKHIKSMLSLLEIENRLDTLYMLCLQNTILFELFVQKESDFFVYFILHYNTFDGTMDIPVLKNYMEAYLDVKITSNILFMFLNC